MASRFWRTIVALVSISALVLTATVACGGSDPAGRRVVVVLQPEPGTQVEDVDAALDRATGILELRLKAFNVDHASVKRVGAQQIELQLPATVSEDTLSSVLRAGNLQFCEPITNDAGEVLVVQGGGKVQYKAGSCMPVRDAGGNVVVDAGSTLFLPLSGINDRSLIVWQPATAVIAGQDLVLGGEYLKPNAFVQLDPITDQPSLVFEFNETGSQIAGAVTERLAADQLPLAPFLDGEPILGDSGEIIAPNVMSQITTSAQITSLSEEEANKLSSLLNSGALPIPLKTVNTAQSDR